MRATWMAALPAGLMLMTGTASAQTPPPAPPRPATVTDPTWASVPSGEELSAAYPEFATAIGQEGEVTLRCTALASGGLDHCEVVDVKPRGLGFDRAGLSLSSLYRVNPRVVDGQDTKSTVQFPIRFRTRPYDPIAPWTGPEPDTAHLAAARVIADRLVPAIQANFLDSLEHIDVDADRVDKVRAMLVQAHEEFLERDKTATVLTMARLLSPAQLAVMAAGGPPPTTPSDEAIASASDQSEAVSRAQMDRLRALYCTQFECPVLSAPSADSVRP
jgi:TonB family protein